VEIVIPGVILFVRIRDSTSIATSRPIESLSFVIIIGGQLVISIGIRLVSVGKLVVESGMGECTS
jgi:hypothetical protein